MIPENNSQYNGKGLVYRQPNLTYNVFDGNNAGNQINSNLKAVQQAVHHILMTERYSNPIYDSNYGVELEQYKGADFAIIYAGIEFTLRDALLQDDRITNIEMKNIKQTDEDSCIVEFIVYTIYGSFNENLKI